MCNKKPLPVDREGAKGPDSSGFSRLVRALGKEGDQDHQVGQRKQPLVGLNACALRGASNESKVTALCEIVHMLDANASEVGDFSVGEDFLTRFDGNHVRLASFPANPAQQL